MYLIFAKTVDLKYFHNNSTEERNDSCEVIDTLIIWVMVIISQFIYIYIYIKTQSCTRSIYTLFVSDTLIKLFLKNGKLASHCESLQGWL